MREEDTVCVGSDGLQYCKVCGEAKCRLPRLLTQQGLTTIERVDDAG